jgi:hypothetical protein
VASPSVSRDMRVGESAAHCTAWTEHG